MRLCLAALGLYSQFAGLVNALVHTSWRAADGGLPSVYLERPEEPGPIPAVPSWGLTVVIMGYKDQPGMTRTACHHGSMLPLVKRVLLVWNSDTEKWKGDVKCKGGPTAEIKVLPQKYNTLLNRWAVWPEVDTEGVLLLDDDILIKDMKNLEQMYGVWRKHPQQVVGLVGRCPYQTASGFVYDYRQCEGQISLTNGQGNMLHRNLMQLFMAKQPDAMLEHMYMERPTCEDIALSFVVSNKTGLPPLEDRDVFEEQEIERLEMHDGETKEDWLGKRSACMDKFTRIYGRYPLVGALPP